MLKRLPLLALALCAGCVTVPPRPVPATVPPELARLKLGIGSLKGVSLNEAYVRPALEMAASAAGLRLVTGAADAWLDFTIDPGGATFTPYTSHLALRDGATGRQAAEATFVGGAIGNNFNARAPVYQAIADSIAANLVARLISSPQAADYALNRGRQAPAAADPHPPVEATASAALAPSAPPASQPAPSAPPAPKPERKPEPALEKPTREQLKSIDSQL